MLEYHAWKPRSGDRGACASPFRYARPHGRRTERRRLTRTP
jgi:hypothetical protein